jgi:hypothetical protein
MRHAPRGQHEHGPNLIVSAAKTEPSRRCGKKSKTSVGKNEPWMRVSHTKVPKLRCGFPLLHAPEKTGSLSIARGTAIQGRSLCTCWGFIWRVWAFRPGYQADGSSRASTAS